MRGYLGVDIGTTNIKAVLLGEDGRIHDARVDGTPRIRKDGLEYFDLGAIEDCADAFVRAARGVCDLRGVAFSSVGESVVPVQNGCALSDPLVWYEKRAENTPQETELLCQYGGYARTGLHRNGLFGVNKMLWMRRRLPAVREAENWLPISSYMAYRKTGVAMWDISQACRSYLFDITKGDWNVPLLSALNLAPPGAVGAMGECLGEHAGVRYGLSGHDHVAGLFAVDCAQNGAPFFYDSMGTSCSLEMSTNLRISDREALFRPSPLGGHVSCGLREGTYIAARATDVYGGLLADLMHMVGRTPDAKSFLQINERLCKELPPAPSAVFACAPGTLIRQDNGGSISVSRLELGCSAEEFILGAYLYLCAVTDLLYADLPLCENAAQLPYYAGGGIARNDLFMRLKATLLGREIRVLDIPEITALGAALAAWQATKDAWNWVGAHAVIGPDARLRPLVERTREIYGRENRSV